MMDAEMVRALITVAAAFLGLPLAAWVALRTGRKALFVYPLIQERAEWRRDLRLATAELVTLAHVAMHSPQETLSDLHERRVGVRLRLNPRGGADHPLDQAIMDCLTRLPLLLKPEAGAQMDQAKVLDCLETLEASVQALLKAEWDKSNRETRER